MSNSESGWHACWCSDECVLRCMSDGCDELVECRLDGVEVLVQHIVHTPATLSNVALD